MQVYLVEGEPLTLIDAGLGSPECRAALESALDELGYGLAEIERVVLTHSHPEQAGAVQSIRDAGAVLECCVHERDARRVEAPHEVLRAHIDNARPLLAEYGMPDELLERTHRYWLEVLPHRERECEPTAVDRVLRQDDRVVFKDFTLRVHHSPGHTPGHILLEDEELGVLFAGDQIMAGAIPNAENHYLEDALPIPGDRLHRRPRFRGLVEMRRSLRRLRARRVKRLLSALGGTIQRPDRMVRDTLLYYDVRLQRIDRALRHLAALGQDVTAFEIWSSLFPQDEPYDVMREHITLLIGALDCLEEEGKIETVRRPDGVLVHRHL